jgi:hypothetical protein
MNAASRFIVLAAGALAGTGCGQEATRPPAPASGIVLGTDLGPVDLLSFTEGEEGFRRIGVHAVLEDGRHAVRTISVRSREVPDGRGTVEFTGLVQDGEATTFLMMRRVHEDAPDRTEAWIACGGESLEMRAEPLAGTLRVVVEHRRPGAPARERILYLDPESLGDPLYTAAVQRELDAFYPSGPLLEHPDRKLLEGVLASEDWGAYLVQTPGGAANRDKRMKQVCAAASAVSLISCKVAIAFAPAWFACVPATGIAVACLVNQVQEAFFPGAEGPCACTCMCNELQPPPPPPPPPTPTPEP